MLSLSELILVSIVVGALALIVSGKLRADIVALLVMLSLTAVGFVTIDEALSGFSRSVIFILLGLFIIGEALENTGVTQSLANRLRQLGGGSEARLMLIFMTVGAALSVIMSTVAAAAVLLPAAVQVGRESNVRPSKLLIPLAFGSLVGGMATLFTTANIIVSGILVEQKQPPLTMSSFLLTGGLIVVAAIVYMVLIGRRLLPDRESVGQGISPALLSRNLYDTYELEDRLWEVRVPPACQLVNTALSHSRIGEELGITVLAIWRGQQAILTPDPIEVINPGDYLLVLGREDRVKKLSDWGVVVGRENGNGRHHHHDYSVDLTEVIIPPRSKAIGQTLTDLRFRSKFGLTTVAVWREGRSARTDVGKFPLQVGDALLMVGPARKIKALAQERDFLVLQSSHLYQPPLPQKALLALVITLLTLAAAIFGLLPTAEAVLVGAVAMVLTGCLTMDEAYRSVDWRVIFLIAGMLPISVAMVKTGLAAQTGDLLISALSPYGTLALLAGIYLLTMLVSQVIGGQVAALVVGPVAIAAALRVGVNPQAVGVTVAIGCSSAFLTPIAHSVNVLMMGPGGYRFGDFFRVGLGMVIVTFVALLAGLVVIWGIR